MIESFQLICLSTVNCIRKSGLSEKDCDAHLDAYLAISIFHPALTPKIDISDCRAVIRYLDRQDTSYSFRVTSVFVRTEWCIGKWLHPMFVFITCRSYLAYTVDRKILTGKKNSPLFRWRNLNARKIFNGEQLEYARLSS